MKHKLTMSLSGFPSNESSMVPLSTLASSIPVGFISGVLDGKSIWEGKGLGGKTATCMMAICNSYRMGARAIHQILALSPRAEGECQYKLFCCMLQY